MEQLIQDYLNSTGNYSTDLGCGVVKRVEPFIEDGEQQFEATVTNSWLDSGVETVHISISDLLGFMHSVKK